MSALPGGLSAVSAVPFLIRGSINFGFRITSLTPKEKDTLRRRTQLVVFNIERDLKRIVYRWGIDVTGDWLSMSFLPEIWVPFIRKELTQENVNNAVVHAITKVEERDVRRK